MQKKKKKRKQSNITKNTGNIFQLNWICWSLWKVWNLNRANEKLFSFDLIEQKFPFLRKDKIDRRKLNKDSYEKNFFRWRIVRLNFPKFGYWKNYKFKNVKNNIINVKNNILIESNDYLDLIKFKLNHIKLRKIKENLEKT